MFNVCGLSRDKLFNEIKRKDARLRMLVGHVSVLKSFEVGGLLDDDDSDEDDDEEDEEQEVGEGEEVEFDAGIEVSKAGCEIEVTKAEAEMDSKSNNDEVNVDDLDMTWVQKKREEAIMIYTSEIDQDEDHEDTDEGLYMIIPAKPSKFPSQPLRPTNVTPRVSQRPILPSPQVAKGISARLSSQPRKSQLLSLRADVQPSCQYAISTIVYSACRQRLTLLKGFPNHVCAMTDAAIANVHKLSPTLPKVYRWLERFQR